MELLNILTDLKEYLDPQFLINTGGLILLVAIIFAETGLLVGFFLPGDSLLFTAGYLVKTGYFDQNIWVLVGSLIIAAIVGDQVGYLTGRRLGPALFRREESLLFKPKYIERTRAFYDRHGGKTIILGRFVPIVRTFAPIIAGVARFEYGTFVRYNVIGGIVWVAGMTFLGYGVGSILPAKYVELVVLGIIAISVLPVVFTAFKEWRNSQAAQKASAADNEALARSAADEAALADNDPSNDPTTLTSSVVGIWNGLRIEHPLLYNLENHARVNQIPESYINQFITTFQPSLFLFPSDGEADAWMGGKLLSDIGPESIKMELLAVIDCARISVLSSSFIPAFPSHGWLSFWYNAEEQPWGIQSDDSKHWRVIYSEEKPIVSDKAISYAAKIDTTIRSSFVLDWADKLKFNTSQKELESWGQFDNQATDIWRMFGLPDPIQHHEIHTEASEAATAAGWISGQSDDWVLLLQVDSTDQLGFMWGDAGRLYWYISKQDLAQRDFSKVWLVLQCY